MPKKTDEKWRDLSLGEKAAKIIMGTIKKKKAKRNVEARGILEEQISARIELLVAVTRIILSAVDDLGQARSDIYTEPMTGVRKRLLAAVDKLNLTVLDHSNSVFNMAVVANEIHHSEK